MSAVSPAVSDRKLLKVEHCAVPCFTELPQLRTDLEMDPAVKKYLEAIASLPSLPQDIAYKTATPQDFGYTPDYWPLIRDMEGMVRSTRGQLVELPAVLHLWANTEEIGRFYMLPAGEFVFAIESKDGVRTLNLVHAGTAGPWPNDLPIIFGLPKT